MTADTWCARSQCLAGLLCSCTLHGIAALTVCETMQAPAANYKGSQDAMADTFVLSNISPQVGKGFNR